MQKPTSVLYIPYKYRVIHDRGVFLIYARGTSAADKSPAGRKIFELPISSWCFLDWPEGLDDAQTATWILRTELGTDQIFLDETTSHFIVSPGNSLSPNVRASVRRSVMVELTTYNVLSRFGHRFFDPLAEDGQWVTDKDASLNARSLVTSTHTSHFQILVVTPVDSQCIAFVKMGKEWGSGGAEDDKEGHRRRQHDLTVHIWTTYSAFENARHISAASASLAADPNHSQSATTTYDGEPLQSRNTELEACGGGGGGASCSMRFGGVSRETTGAPDNECVPSHSNRVGGGTANREVLDIVVRTFTTPSEMVSSFVAEILKDRTDILVHYGIDSVTEAATTAAAASSSCCCSIISDAVRRLENTATSKHHNGSHLEIFDMKDYIKNVYSDFPSHDLATVLREVSLTTTGQKHDGEAALSPTTDEYHIGDSSSARSLTDCILSSYLSFSTVSDTLLSSDATASSSSSSHHYQQPRHVYPSSSCLASSSHHHQCTASFIPNIGTTPHTPENVVFFLEKISARTFLMGRLFNELRASIFDLSFHSGCNISALTDPQHTARGVVSCINPVVACSPIFYDDDAILPLDFMKPGVHGLTYVISISGFMVDALEQSDHAITADIGRKISPVRTFGWVVKSIFSMKDLKPKRVVLPPCVYGKYRNMLHSYCEVPNYDAVRIWSTVINVGLGSWIGISMTLPPQSSNEDDDESSGGGGGIVSLNSASNLKNTDIRFGYYGISNVCSPPFEAAKTAVEMYLSLKIATTNINSGSPSISTISSTTPLTPQNMAVTRRVTEHNLQSYYSLLTAHDASLVGSGKCEIILRMWYRSPSKFTTNELLADRHTYVKVIDRYLTDTFSTLEYNTCNMDFCSPYHASSARGENTEGSKTTTTVHHRHHMPSSRDSHTHHAAAATSSDASTTRVVNLHDTTSVSLAAPTAAANDPHHRITRTSSHVSLPPPLSDEVRIGSQEETNETFDDDRNFVAPTAVRLGAHPPFRFVSYDH
jgi:hypothetical protein